MKRLKQIASHPNYAKRIITMTLLLFSYFTFGIEHTLSSKNTPLTELNLNTSKTVNAVETGELLKGIPSASSEMQPASFAQDGDINTRWESTHTIDPSWLSLDLNQKYSLSQIEIFWEAANADTYVIQGSGDNDTWEDIALYSGGVFGSRTDTHFIAGTYRYIRIYGISRSQGNHWGYSIYEVRIYGTNLGNPTPSPTPSSLPPQPKDSDGDGIHDDLDKCPSTVPGTVVDHSGCPINITGEIEPLFTESTPQEPAIQFDRGDALVTRIADRARDRHAREDQFQAYDHYLPFYWENRTASIEIVDYVAKGGNTIEMTIITQWPLSTLDNRWWYYGANTVAEYYDNSSMTEIGERTYLKSSSINFREGGTIKAGQSLEFEPSQFLQQAGLPRGRANYYGTTFLYITGQGLVPYGTHKTAAPHKEDSFALPHHTWMGGSMTLPYNFSNEPDNNFMQMATNISAANGQAFVLGRRLHHSSFIDGSHDENPENGSFEELIGLAGPRYINNSCSSCHVRNGRAPISENGKPLDRWVIKIGNASGNGDADRGSVLQPKHAFATETEGSVSIANWTELENGLRKPNYDFSSSTPVTFSARIAPNLYGLGLLEAVPETTIMALADPEDDDGNGISGKVSRVIDPLTGATRLGRFGYKASTMSIEHQVSAALNTDMGVMTPMMPKPDCGIDQGLCENSGVELNQNHVNNLVKYLALLGVRPQRDYNHPEVETGKDIFSRIGCDLCHIPTLQTSALAKFAETRDLVIHPYTDLLLHDMGEGLADNLGEGLALGSEWRTAPLWGVGLSKCVTGGVTNPSGNQGDEICTPSENYLHDGRARTLDEAIRWHGGEGENAKQAYEALEESEQRALIRFIESL